jgi:hypothetical protein
MSKIENLETLLSEKYQEFFTQLKRWGEYGNQKIIFRNKKTVRPE